MDFSRLPPRESSRLLAPMVERAVQLHNQGATEEAEKLALEILELAPNQIEALSILYRVRRAGGRERAADILLRRIVALTPIPIGRPTS